MEQVNRHRAILILLMLCFMPLGASTLDSLQVKIDSSNVHQRTFDADLSDKYSGSEFDYTSVEGEAQNFLARAIEWFFRKLGEIFGFEMSPGVYQVVEFIVYVLLGILVLYLLVRFLTGNAAAAVFGRKSATLAPLNIEEEHIENVDLDKYIKDALAQKDYRLAIRYMYLKALRELSRYNIIDWHYDKTNLDYLREIENEGLKQRFRQVSYLYDYIWYGEFAIDDNSFALAKQDFDRLNKNLANVR